MTAPTFADYAAFLPETRARRVDKPEETWWYWGDNDVQVARRANPDAQIRLLLIHGAGGHSGALWPLVAQLDKNSVDIAAVDLPLFGRTVSADPSAIRYETWIEMLKDFIAAEDDGRPLVIFGASIGGLLAFEVAALTANTNRISAVVTTCLLDPRDSAVLAKLTRFGWFASLVKPFLPLVRGRLARMMVRMPLVAKLNKMSLNPDLSDLCARDSRGGGANVPVGFFASFMQYRHRAHTITTAPLTVLHPERDDWTPARLTKRYLEKVERDSSTEVKVTLLPECGHFPIEEPGVTMLVDSLEAILRSTKMK